MPYRIKTLCALLLVGAAVFSTTAQANDDKPIPFMPLVEQAGYVGAVRQAQFLVPFDLQTSAAYYNHIDDRALWVQGLGQRMSWKSDNEAFKFLNYGVRVLVGSNVFVRHLSGVTAYVGVFGGYSQAKDKVRNYSNAQDSANTKTHGWASGAYLTLLTNTEPDSGGALDVWVQYNRFKHALDYGKISQDFVSRGVSFSLSVRHRSLAYVQGLDSGDTINFGIEPLFRLSSLGASLKPFNTQDGLYRVSPFNVYNLQWTLGLNLTVNQREVAHTLWDAYLGVAYLGTWKAEGVKYTVSSSYTQPFLDPNVPPADGMQSDVGVGSTYSSKAGLNRLRFSLGFRVYGGEHLNAKVGASYTLGDNNYHDASVHAGLRLNF